MSSHKQYGFAHIGLIVLLIVVVGIAGFVGWRISQNNNSTSNLAAPTTPCEGRLYDSHAHPDDDEIIGALPNIMTKHDVGCTVLFTQMDLDSVDESLLDARERYAGMPGRISIFYDVIGESPNEVTVDKLRELYEKSEGQFTGLGEFAFYEEHIRDIPFTDPGWQAIFEFANEKGLVVMIHPQREMLSGLETMLVRYPDTNVLVHGFELPDLMGDLLQEHANLYFTLDTATLLTFDSDEPGTPVETLFYPSKGPERTFDAATFIEDYDAKHEQVLAAALQNWLPVLLASPKKVLWGTDISLAGHVDTEVYQRVMNLTNAFLEEVPEEYRRGYLRDNAYNLLGAGQTLKEPTDEEIEQIDSGEE